MIWSIMPEEIIIGNGEKGAAMREIVYQNRRLLATPLPTGRMCIVRVLSSNPRDFMDPRFQPGNIIDFYHT